MGKKYCRSNEAWSRFTGNLNWTLSIDWWSLYVFDRIYINWYVNVNRAWPVSMRSVMVASTSAPPKRSPNWAKYFTASLQFLLASHQVLISSENCTQNSANCIALPLSALQLWLLQAPALRRIWENEVCEFKRPQRMGSAPKDPDLFDQALPPLSVFDGICVFCAKQLLNRRKSTKESERYLEWSKVAI